MQTTAKLRHLRQSPRKVRLVADMIRGLDVLAANDQLKFVDKRATKPILKLINSAIANAEHNDKLTKENLFIKEIRVDEGPTLKRWRPRAFGRAGAIRKRTSHISLILAEKIPTDKKIKPKDKAEKVDTKIVRDLSEVEKDIKTDKEDKKDKDSQAKKFTGDKTGQGKKAKVFNRKSG